HSFSYKCCLSIGTMLLGLATSLAISSDALAYTLDAQSRTITVEPSENAAPDLINALTYLAKRPDQSNLWTVKFQPGVYRIHKQVQVDNLQNVALESNPKAPAILTKS